MKKIFSLLATILFAGSMMAGTLVEYNHTATLPAGVKISGTTVLASVKIHTNADSQDCIQLKNGYTTDNVFNGNAIILNTDGGFKAGDTLSVAAFFNNADDTKVAKVELFTVDNAGACTAVWTSAQCVNGRTVNDDPVLESYVLTADMDSILLGRNGNTGTNLYTIKVARPEAAPVVDGAVKGVYDFGAADSASVVWNLPFNANKLVNDVATYTDGVNTLTATAVAGGTYYFHNTYSADDYWAAFFGKNGASLSVSTDYAVSTIKYYGVSGASAGTVLNFYVGEEVIGTHTGSKDTFEIAVPAAYQAAGTVYTVKVSSSHNAQCGKLELIEATDAPEPQPSANLFDAATTIFESWFGDAGWAPINTSTAAWDATTGTITANINQDPYGQWHAQLKLHTTGIVLDPAKNYEFKATFLSTMTAGGITAKVFDDAELTMKGDIAVEANTPYAYTSAPFVGASIGNGVIVFDLGNCPNGAVVTISDIALVESNQEIVVPTEPKPTTAPAAPTADAATVLSVYSNTYPAASAVGYCEGWGQTTALEELNLDGNTVLYYKNFNYLGWGVANPIDASTCTGLHLDIWANGAGNINVWPIFGGAGLATDDSKYATVALVEGWNSVNLDFATNFAGLDLTSIFQFKFADLTTTDKVVAIDNVYFYGYVAPAVVYKSLAEVYNLAKNDVVDLKAFDVVYVNGSNIYVKDATAAGLLYANNYGLVAGDHVAAGLQGTVDIFNGIYEVKPTTAFDSLTVTAGEAPAPAVATAAPTAADQNKYVVYKDVTFNVADTLTNAAKTTVYGVFKGDTVAFYNNFKIAASFEAGKTYDVVAVNAMYKTNVQVYPIEITEHETVSVECDGEHGLYNPATATINDTYLAPNWDLIIAGADHYAEMENGNIVLHVGAQGYVDMWQGQVFVDPGFTFVPGKAYHYEFDVISAGKVCMTVKVNDSDADYFLSDAIYDINIGGGVYHYSTDNVFANENLNTAKGPLVFGFGWTDADQDVIISCIKITEAGDVPEPVVEKMYMKHPWGTGANDDWTWKELEKTTFKNVDAWTITEAWGGVGFNIADNAEGNDAAWYAAETIQFLDSDGALVEAPAVGTANCEFYFVPVFVGGITTPAYVVVPAAQGILNATQNNAVKAIVNGNVVIIRNGVRYNLVGARF